MRLRFLLDENLSPRLTTAIKRHYPHIDVLRIGEPDAPPLSTLDPDILHYLEANQRVLVTDNRASIPGHLNDHFATGHHHWGIFIVRKDAPLGLLVLERQTRPCVPCGADRTSWSPNNRSLREGAGGTPSHITHYASRFTHQPPHIIPSPPG